MPRGPMAKDPSVRQRKNAATTSRAIVLHSDPETGLLRGPDSELRAVPELPVRYRQIKDESGAIQRVESEWHEQSVVAWAELWQFPLVYQAPAVDHHLLRVYITLLDDFHTKAEQGKAITEQANQIRTFSEQWGVGEKSRRHLQITIQEAEEAIERGRKATRTFVDSEATPIEGSAQAYLPEWNDDDEDDGSIIEAEVVAE